MTRWFALDEVGPEVFTEAPHVDVRVMDLAAPAAEVWAGLTGDTPLDWCRRLRGGRYLTPAPHGVGTRRQIAALGLLRLRESFFRWDEDAMRHSFHVTHASLPVFRYFAEDYLVEPTPTGCRFTWTFALAARPALARPVALTHPANRRLLYDSFARDTVRRFGAA